VLNSVFLHDAVESRARRRDRHASKIEPLNRIGEQALKVARDLIYDRREFDGEVSLTSFDAVHYALRNVKAKSAKKARKARPSRASEESHHDGEKIGLEAELTTALETYRRSTSSTTSCSKA